MDDVNSDEVMHAFNKCVKQQVVALISRICESENLNFVEIAETYGLINNTENTIYKPKKKRKLKIPEPAVRCEAISAEGEQCRRTKKDDCAFCRRHKYKQTYGTIHTTPVIKKSEEETVVEEETEENSNLEIEYNGNIITLEDGTEVIYIPSTTKCYSYNVSNPKYLGRLSPDMKTIIN